MKAVIIERYGGPEVLRYADVPTPKPGADEVLVQVQSTSVNPIDYKLRSGHMKDRMPLQFPAILGRDVAGTVVEVGIAVSNWKPGDAVLGFVRATYAEYIVAKASELSRPPLDADLATLGRLPLVCITGAQLIEKGVTPKQGDRVLVTGALGSVGRVAVYVARQHGALVIAGVRRNQVQAAAALQAEAVVALDDDEATRNFVPFDGFADTIGGDVIAKLLPKWTRKGRFASVVGTPDAARAANVEVVNVVAQPDAERLAALAADAVGGKFDIPVGAVFSLSDAAEAHRKAESGAAGKIILQP